MRDLRDRRGDVIDRIDSGEAEEGLKAARSKGYHPYIVSHAVHRTRGAEPRNQTRRK